LPIALIARQPDLGTSLLITRADFMCCFLAGLSWRVIGGCFVAALASAPVLWVDAARLPAPPHPDAVRIPRRTRWAMVITPSRRPSPWVQAAYLGKGYRNGTQTHLDFLPERTTDSSRVYSKSSVCSAIWLLLLLYPS